MARNTRIVRHVQSIVMKPRADPPDFRRPPAINRKGRAIRRHSGERVYTHGCMGAMREQPSLAHVAILCRQKAANLGGDGVAGAHLPLDVLACVRTRMRAGIA